MPLFSSSTRWIYLASLLLFVFALIVFSCTTLETANSHYSGSAIFEYVCHEPAPLTVRSPGSLDGLLFLIATAALGLLFVETQNVALLEDGAITQALFQPDPYFNDYLRHALRKGTIHPRLYNPSLFSFA